MKQSAFEWIIMSAVTVLAVFFTFVIHEFAHGVAGVLLGYDMYVRANSSDPVSGHYKTVVDELLVDAAGPLTTVLQAAFACWFAHVRSWKFLPQLALSALLMRVLAAVASLSSPNDEARVALELGLGFWTLHALVIGVLLALTVQTFRVRSIRLVPGVVMGVCAVFAMVGVVVLESSLPTIRLSPLTGAA